MHALEGRHVSKDELASEAIHVEHASLHEPVGAQDQISAAFGGFNHITFQRRTAPIRSRRSCCRAIGCEALQEHLMLLFTGLSRTAAEMARTRSRTSSNGRAKCTRMRQMVDRGDRDPVDRRRRISTSSDGCSKEAWTLKRRLSDSVSNSGYRRVYETALRAGAIGGKLLGAGGGGFLLLFVRPEDRARVRAALPKLITCRSDSRRPAAESCCISRTGGRLARHHGSRFIRTDRTAAGIDDSLRHGEGVAGFERYHGAHTPEFSWRSIARCCASGGSKKRSSGATTRIR